MNERRRIEWLLSELDVLEREGTLDAATGESVRARYERRLAALPARMNLPAMLGALSALLVGLGVVLVISFNWDKIGKAGKTGIAFGVLLAAQGFGLVALTRAKGAGRREGAALLWAIAFGAVVFFIGQIFQLPSNARMFVALWSASTLAIAYLFGSIAAAVGYAALVLAFVSIEQNMNGVGLWFFPMLAALAPRYEAELRAGSDARATAFRYVFVVAAAAGLGVSLEKVVPGLWLPAYAGLFGCLHAFGALREPDGISAAWSPFRLSGTLGAAVLAFIFSWQWPWRNVGWGNLREGVRFHALASAYDFVVIVACFALLAVFAAALVKRRKRVDWFAVAFAPFTLALYLGVSAFGGDELAASVAAWIVNAFIVAWCVTRAASGVKRESLLEANAALVFAAATILARFFDETASILARGVAFIVCGAGIGIVNAALSKLRARKEAAREET